MTWIENMSASNEELETISLYDMVEDLVHDKSEINEDQNDVDLSKWGYLIRRLKTNLKNLKQFSLKARIGVKTQELFRSLN